MGVKAPPRFGHRHVPSIVAYERVSGGWVVALVLALLVVSAASVYSTEDFARDLVGADPNATPPAFVTFLIFAGVITVNILLVVPYMQGAAHAANKAIVADKDW